MSMPAPAKTERGRREPVRAGAGARLTSGESAGASPARDHSALGSERVVRLPAGPLAPHPSAHGTSTESSVGLSRATTYSAASLSERLRTMCVCRGGT